MMKTNHQNVLYVAEQEAEGLLNVLSAFVCN